MNKIQAIKALQTGKTIRHVYFTPEEWMKQTGCLYEFEDGCMCEPEQFWRIRIGEGWNEGWSLWEEEETKP